MLLSTRVGVCVVVVTLSISILSVVAQDVNKFPYYPPPVPREDLPVCLNMALDNVPKFHKHDSCDLVQHNSWEKRILRHERYHDLLRSGINHIPEEKTVHCPMRPQKWEQATHGHDTKWFVENQSSGPIVVVYQDPHDGLEYSALNSDVTPPQNDEAAILEPGHFATMDVYEGHTFYVRALDRKTNTLGDVLLQHRPGLVHLTNRFGGDALTEQCFNNRNKPKLPPKRHLEQLSPKKQHDIVTQALERVDPEPKITVKNNNNNNEEEEERIHPDYERSPSHRGELCHVVYKGFRNTLDHCPLHVFFTGLQVPNGGDMVCAEEFKFHLGMHDTPEDYMFDWHSRTKFESTYVGHTFVARLAKNPSILVDTYTVQPTVVHDCDEPERRVLVQQESSDVTQEGVQNNIAALVLPDPLHNNNTAFHQTYSI